MEMAAHRPEEFLAAPEKRKFARRKQPSRNQLPRVPHAIDVFRDPEQRVEIAQAALPLFDVRLHEIARLAGAPDPRVALRELGRDEFASGPGDDFLVEARDETFEKRAVAAHEP